MVAEREKERAAAERHKERHCEVAELQQERERMMKEMNKQMDLVQQLADEKRRTDALKYYSELECLHFQSELDALKEKLHFDE